MFPRSTSSNLSEAIIRRKKLEKNFLENQFLSIDHDRNKIRLNHERHMETFLQLNRKRHETWYRYDKHFREALKKEKDRYEKRKERHGSTRNLHMSSFPSLITLNSRPEPMTKVEQRTFKVLNASQKLLDESIARSRSNFNQSRPLTSTSTFKSSSIITTRSSCTNISTNFNIPMMQSIDFEEYTRLMNESLKRETYCDFVDHFVKFSPEFREKFANYHQANKRKNAVEKLREFNQTYAKTKDQRYHNLMNNLIDFRSKQK
ncbi:unnamed protein product [Rotaria sp. Silwood2]|nr:unnamed protein product [Rotaria sp. Silwood2]CAF2794712.1 unnamed protein product [Rotaria sp. Silwood2]CAF3052099.1 unnamed protein product [Rotaria sp. Silwood2]CAF3212531.1 unnamed protein product [Rotaria sp. Silwood2]CAF4065133.1 unnamed protein product [Rotaria sp. Silwood2]